MEALLQLNAVTSSTNIQNLRKLYDTIESHVRGLKSFGISADSYGSLLSSVLMNKLPHDFRLMISSAIKEDNWELEELLTALKTEISARERSETLTLPCVNSAHQTPIPTAAFAVDNSQHRNCIYCNELHNSSSCKKVSTPDARKEVNKLADRCFICLQRGHLAARCWSGRRYHHSGSRHHSSICKQEKTAPTIPNNAAHVPVTNVNHVASSTTSHTPVFLQTASVMVYNPDHSDSGSQRSYNSSRVKDALSLETAHTETLGIKMFGNIR
jgi:hypothetical protein